MTPFITHPIYDTTRQKYWNKRGRQVTPIHQVPDDETARGVEQIEIEKQRAAGNQTAKEQNNSIDTSRKDDKAQRMRQKGQNFMDNKGGSGDC